MVLCNLLCMWKLTQVLFVFLAETIPTTELNYESLADVWKYIIKMLNTPTTFLGICLLVCVCICDVHLLVYSICKWSLFTLPVFVLTFNFALMNMNVVVQVLLNSHSLFISCCTVTAHREKPVLSSYLHSGNGAFNTDCTLHQQILFTLSF